MNTSKIEWTEATWNPVSGCTKLSAGCKNCYAEKNAKWLKGMNIEKYRNGFELTCHPYLLKEPLKWKKGKKIFVNSMSDLFHEDVPVSFIQSVFETMTAGTQHQFQILTKRSERLCELRDELDWRDNIWMGVTVENADYLFRINDLRKTDAAVKFLSLEPLLGPIPDINLSGIDWVIVGGESGTGARPMKEEWVIDIRDECVASGVSFFFKQWGGKRKKENGRLLKGKVWDQRPDIKGSDQGLLLCV